MALFIGILGLPNVGKSTLFNALTCGEAVASNYPFTTVDPNVGIVDVPDSRLDHLRQILAPSSCTPTSIRFVDIAGLVRGASRGEGLGNRFLAQVREADALIHVLRCFGDEGVSHVDGTIDPLRDMETIEVELILADLEVIAKALPRLEKIVQTDPSSSQKAEVEALRRAEAALNNGALLSNAGISDLDREVLHDHRFLTLKPVLYAANVSEEEIGGAAVIERVGARVGAERVIPVAAQIEAEMVQLDESDRQEFLADLGLETSGVGQLIQSGYRLLSLITFYTHANGKLQAWQLPQGSPATVAAGRIHTDMQEGFIRAEVVAVADLEQAGSMAALRENGKLRTEGRDYFIRDGDVVNFLFSN